MTKAKKSALGGQAMAALKKDVFNPNMVPPSLQQTSLDEVVAAQETQLAPKEEPILNQPDPRPTPAPTPFTTKAPARKSVKATVVLGHDAIVFLDRLSSNIRANTMAIVDRSSIIRALVGALEKSGMNINDITSEEELRDILLSQFQK